MFDLRPLARGLLAVSLIVGLAAVVRMAGPAADDATLSGTIRLPWSVTSSIATLFSLATLVFIVGLLRRMRSRRHGEDETVARSAEKRPDPWLRVLTQFLAFVNFGVVAYLLWKNVLPLDGLEALGLGGAGGGGNASDAAPDAPFLVTWSFGFLALLAGVAALALALWFTSGDRLATWWTREDDEAEPPAPLVAAVDDSLDDLRTEPDPRRAIIRCYARFERAAAASGFARRPWHTPMEFMRETLLRLPAPRDAVRALTALFEVARFSDRTLGATERDHALDALDHIKAAIDVAR